MAELAAVAVAAGFKAPRTYIQSGNLVLDGGGKAKGVEAKLEAALALRFGFPVEVLARTAEEWGAMAAANPFDREAKSEPNRVMMLVSREPARADAARALLARAADGERVAAAHGALWVYYAAGAGKSKLTPSLVDRVVGSKVTARNW